MRQSFGDGDRVTLELGEDGVAQVRLNRPDKLNALDPAMFEAIVAAGHALHGLKGLRAVVLAGEGRAFCAGLDMASFAGPEPFPITERTHGIANTYQRVALQWRDLPVPVVAAVHGVCFGGGLQIASGADIRVAAPDARLSIMELKWGIVPDMGGFALWRGLVRDDMLRELVFTAREFSGEEAQALGLATIVDPDPLARATALARDIAGRSPHAIRATKALANRAHGLSVAEILIEESRAQHELIYSKNQIEAVMSQMQGRAPSFDDP
ncbi:MAG: crotonase/enoyl-CoA hydratase family protein [Candidatus Andeanibacterium colombiense]|uniref:Crotonase/enoyl-CoA hydratase family protein n=1 Tax=Candidatus Andeanibacterium colombiense TaxID=3121345 RepID=A0AAJ5X9T3_9SPHN|nr:MAG: crotonase/enoyl-CoA hydratase family protein [Sphingomonadaceae bacterium]